VIKRIIDISEQAYIHLKNRQIIVERTGKPVDSIAVEDIGVLILQHPAIVITQALIIACQKNNSILIFCDDRHLPYSIILPVSDGNILHNKILKCQIELKTTARKRLWQQIVKHKINQQANTLKLLGKNAKPIEKLVTKIKTGDQENHEGQAAKKYWNLLMGNSFHRDTNADGVNALLNYGYAIMRAMIARAIVASGLHPAIGLHHHNQYNGLCLADDLMEPFRPWVDHIVYQATENKTEIVLNQELKQSLLNLLSQSVNWEGRAMPLMVACHYLMANLKRAYTDSNVRIDYPILLRN